MQAVILAGGLGTRLRPITTTISKPMVPVNGEPYLKYQLVSLREQGITEILLLTGYLGEQIEAFFGDGDSLGLSIRYSREPQPLGTGGAVQNAEGMLAPEFLLIYGDSYLPIRYGALLETLAARDVSAVMAVYDNSLADTSVRNNIALGNQGLVTRYAKQGVGADLRYVDAGVLALRRSVVDLLPHGAQPVSLEEVAYPELIARGRLAGYVTDRRFYDIGTPERLQAFENFITHDYYANALSN